MPIRFCGIRIEGDGVRPIIDILIAVADKGGVENVIKMVIPFFEERGVHIRLVQAVWEHHNWTSAETEFHYLFDDGREQDSDKFTRGYRDFLSAHGAPDIVLATCFPMMCMVARNALLELGVSRPIVSWLHAPLSEYDRVGVGGARQLKYADLHFAISEDIGNEIRELLPDSYVFRVYNPVNSDKVYFSANRSSGQLAFVGRLSKEKNIGSVLRAVALAQSFWTLILIGEGEEEEELKKMAEELGISRQVSFEGWSENPWTLCRDSYGLVMASYFEGFPLTAIEALACGMPVISTPVSGIKELIKPGETGFLFPHNDSEFLSRILDMIAGGQFPPVDAEKCKAKALPYRQDVALSDFYEKLMALL
ncbi:MAG: glycosyltransferase [Lachnospiraceae bacterium]|nr:glycosyltransferase [Lachnospiraceae bacterium]